VAVSIICERAFEFSRRILLLSDRLAARGFATRHIADELARSASSIGANAEEAQDAQTKPDYIAKMSIARKEARETLYWLRLASATGAMTREAIDAEIKEAGGLRATIVSAIRTAQSNPDRG
jgi:four helix bundle protein